MTAEQGNSLYTPFCGGKYKPFHFFFPNHFYFKKKKKKKKKPNTFITHHR